MSNNIVPVNLVRTDYPLTAINNRRSWAVLKGCGENSFQKFPSSSFNNSQISITCNPPSNKTVVNRLIWLKNVYNIAFTGADTGSPLLQIGSNDSLRCQPIAATTNTVQVSINNDQFSANLNQYWTGLSRYHNTLNNRDEFLSMTPSFMDKAQTYAELIGGTRNPLGDYKSSADGQILRGGYANIIVNAVDNVNTQANLTVTVTEPLYLSPFLFSGEDCLDSGLIGVNNMSLVITNGPLERIWSHNQVAPAHILSTIVCNLVSSEAEFNYATPNLVDALPLAQSWPYAEVTSYPTNIPIVMAPGEERPVTMNSVQIKAIPDKIYIFARRSDATQTAYTTDTFAGILNITLTYGNRSGLLSTASQEQLYQVSLKNGLKMNFTEFANKIGSVICLKPGEDIGLDSLSASGKLDNQTLSLTVMVKNLSTESIFFSLYVVVVNSGTVSMVNGSFMHQVGVFSSQDVLNLDRKDAPSVPYEVNNSVYGGSWLDSVKNFFVKVRDTVKPIAGPILDFIPDPRVQAARKIIGVGGKKRKGSKKAPKRRKAGVLVGGEMMSRDMLHDRLMMN